MTTKNNYDQDVNSVIKYNTDSIDIFSTSYQRVVRTMLEKFPNELKRSLRLQRRKLEKYKNGGGIP